MTTETPQYDACCPVVATLDIIGGKWKVLSPVTCPERRFFPKSSILRESGEGRSGSSWGSSKQGK